MAVTRVTHKKKVYHYSEDGVKDANVWIELERLDKLIVETGRGFTYQKTIYNFVWNNELDDGTWDGSVDRTTVKRVKNPDNEGQWVDLPIIDFVIVETGKGITYRKTKHHFNNTDQNDARVTHTKTVKGTDGTSKLDVDVIDKVIREFGRGFSYIKTVVSYNDQGDEQGS